MPPDPARVKAIFLEAAGQPDGPARVAHLDRACGGDADLRARVEALLRSHDAAGSFLGTPAAGVPDAGPDGTGAFDPRSPGGPVGPDAGETPDVLPFLGPSARPDALGRIGHYEVLEVLGKGGFGVVLRAFDEVLQRVVAVKVLAPAVAATSPARKRFVREARSAARVRHPNVVQVYAVEEHPVPYLVMEYIPGETLQQRLDRTGPLDPAEVARVGREIAEGLAAAHATGLVHRDIKPANVLIEAGPTGHVKLSDFGLARAADDASLTQSGMVAGTPLYMAPEQAAGDALDHRADLFSLGSVLYTMCSGRPPFRANSTLAVLRRVAEDTPRPIREIIPEVPAWLCEVVARLHAKRPADRIGTAREVADLLQSGPAGAEPPAPPVVPPASRWRHPRRVAAAAVVLLALAGLGAAEAAGVTGVRGTVVRLFSPEGTLVVQVEDPAVSVTIDGADLVITGAGAKEIRLKTGTYTVEATKDGKVVSRELVSVARDGREVVRVSREPAPPAAATPDPKAAAAAEWERSVAALPAGDRLAAVGARLRELNPGYSGQTWNPKHEDIDMFVAGPELRNLSPVRGLPGVGVLHVGGPNVSDVSPLRGLTLTRLDLFNTAVADLSPLAGMTTLRKLNLSGSRKVADLSPLKGLTLDMLTVASTGVSDLGPVRGMDLRLLNCEDTPVDDAGLAPLAECKRLTELSLNKTRVTASGVAGLRTALPLCTIIWDGGGAAPGPDAKKIPAIP